MGAPFTAGEANFSSIGSARSNSTPYLKDITDRKVRVLVWGDSMTAGVTSAMLSAYDSNILSICNGEGGETTAFTAGVLAPKLTYLARAGNTFPESRLTQWDKGHCTVTEGLEPDSGINLYNVITSEGPYGYLYYVWTVTADQADGCYISWRMKQPTNPDAQFNTSGMVGATAKWNKTFKPSDYIGGVTGRLGFSLPAGWATAGDQVGITIIWDGYITTPPNDVWIGEYSCNLGNMPAPFEKTSGTGNTAEAIAQITAPDAVDRGQFDLVAICHANDAGFGSTRAAQGLAAMVDSALTFAPRVLLMVPPPTYSAGAFIDTDAPLYWRRAVKELCAKRNLFFIDTYQQCLDLVAAGTYTATQLMADAIHFNATGANVVFAKAVADTVASNVDKIPTKLGSGADVRIGSLTHSGTWADAIYAPSQVPPYWFVIGQDFNGSWCQASSDVGATITYLVTGRQISMYYVLGGTDIGGGLAGTATVTVDGRSVGTFPITSGVAYYPRSYRLRNAFDNPFDFGQGDHTVVVTVASGTVRLIGCVGY
jgi:hypothetical protein